MSEDSHDAIAFSRHYRRPSAAHRFVGRVALLVVVVIFCLPGLVKADASVWLLVDSASREVRVMERDRPQAVFSNISVGRGGVGIKQRRGDEVTPQGRFRIAWINQDSPFHRFFGFDFPDRRHADTARAAGVISESTYRRVLSALEDKELPPQGTRLGGFVGIHGLGRADPQVHARWDWTRGCIALTNAQIDELARWVEIGTRVVVR